MPPTHSPAEDLVFEHSTPAETIERHSRPDAHVSAGCGIDCPQA
jgi:hypothetical protein